MVLAGTLREIALAGNVGHDQRSFADARSPRIEISLTQVIANC